MSQDTLRDVVLALLGTGGATFIWTAARSILAFKSADESREDKVISRLEGYERECRAQLERERAWGDYWHRTAATYGYLLMKNGITVPDEKPRPDGGAGGVSER